MSSATDRRWRRWAVGLALAWVLGFGAFWWNREANERSAWQQVSERAAAIAAPFSPIVKAHAPLLGEARPGDAAEHYHRAAQLALQPPRDDSEPDWTEILDVVELPNDLGKHLLPLQPALTALSAGVASDRIDMRPLFDAMRSPNSATAEAPSTSQLPFVANTLCAVSLVAARADLAAGRPDDAVRRTVEVLTLVRDQFDLGLGIYELLGVNGVGIVDRVWTDERLRSLTPTAQRTFAAALQRFDESVPPASTCAPTDCAFLARHAASRRVWLPGGPSQFASYLEAIAALPPPTAPWSARERALAAAAACLPEQAASPLVGIERSRRAACAQIRLLRMALAHLLAEPLAPLADPLGDGPLLDAERGDERALASRGKVDDKPIERTVRVR